MKIQNRNEMGELFLACFICCIRLIISSHVIETFPWILMIHYTHELWEKVASVIESSTYLCKDINTAMKTLPRVTFVLKFIDVRILRNRITRYEW